MAEGEAGRVALPNHPSRDAPMAADLRLRTHFFNLQDPRRAGRSPYRLLDLIFMAIAAAVAGAQDFGQVEAFARKRKDWLPRFCRLPTDGPGQPLAPCQD